MIPRAIAEFVNCFSDYGSITLDVQRVLSDPGAFLFKLTAALPSLIELLEDHYAEKIENLKIGDVINELDN